MVNVLFVCLGNICRSPTAEGVFRTHVAQAGYADRITCDSAGTSDWHIGNPPHIPAIRASARRGYDLSTLRARQVVPADFEHFDMIIAMDRSNHDNLCESAPAGFENRLHMMMSFAPTTGFHEVPDPYYGGGEDFERVLDLLEVASRGLLDDIVAEHLAV